MACRATAAVGRCPVTAACARCASWPAVPASSSDYRQRHRLRAARCRFDELDCWCHLGKKPHRDRGCVRGHLGRLPQRTLQVQQVDTRLHDRDPEYLSERHSERGPRHRHSRISGAQRLNRYRTSHAEAIDEHPGGGTGCPGKCVAGDRVRVHHSCAARCIECTQHVSCRETRKIMCAWVSGRPGVRVLTRTPIAG